MPSDYYFGYYFFAPSNRFKPCGMFTPAHIIATFVCLILIALILFFSKKHFVGSAKQSLIRKFAILLTVLEIIKISHSFIYNELYLDAWVPLSYCGLFIYALWMAGYGKGKLKRLGEVFIAYGCPIAGLLFLIFPTTSLMSFPVWHYFSLYSLFYHSVMIFIGIVSLLNEKRFDGHAYLNYTVFYTAFAIPALILNYVFNSNFMNLRWPYNIPVQLLQYIYAASKPGYTLLVIGIYLLIPLLMGMLNNAFKRKKKINTGSHYSTSP